MKKCKRFLFNLFFSISFLIVDIFCKLFKTILKLKGFYQVITIRKELRNLVTMKNFKKNCKTITKVFGKNIINSKVSDFKLQFIVKLQSCDL